MSYDKLNMRQIKNYLEQIKLLDSSNPIDYWENCVSNMIIKKFKKLYSLYPDQFMMTENEKYTLFLINKDKQILGSLSYKKIDSLLMTTITTIGDKINTYSEMIELYTSNSMIDSNISTFLYLLRKAKVDKSYTNKNIERDSKLDIIK